MTFELRWRNECDFCLTVFRSKNCWLVLVSDKKNGWRLDRVLWCSYWNVLSKHLPARADVPCVCERGWGGEKYVCVVLWGWCWCITHTILYSCLFECVPTKQEVFHTYRKSMHHMKPADAEYYWQAGLWDIEKKRLRQAVAHPGCFEMATRLNMCLFFSCFTYFAWLAATHSVGEDWAKRCCLQIKSNFIKCVDWREAGGYTNQFWVSPYLPIGIRTKKPPKNGAETLRGGNSEAIWLANQAMHICMLIMWQEGGKEWKAPPMRETERGRGRQDIEWDTREKGGRATEQMDKQTKESKGPIDEMGN